MRDLFLLIPIISISVSIVLSKILVLTLFYPTKKKRILVFETQGLIYFYKEKIIRDLADFLEKELNKDLPEKINKEIDKLELIIREKIKDFVRKRLNEENLKLNMPDYVFFLLESLIMNSIEEISLEIKKLIKESLKKAENKKIGTEAKKLVLNHLNKISNEQIKDYIEKFFGNLIDVLIIYSAVLGLVIGFFIDLFLLMFFF